MTFQEELETLAKLDGWTDYKQFATWADYPTEIEKVAIQAAELYARSMAAQSLKEIEELKSKNFASERLRMEDAFSAINEVNQLREKIKEQDLIIYGIEEGSGQWQSLCADKEREIFDLKAKINSMAAQAWEEGFLSDSSTETTDNPYKL